MGKKRLWTEMFEEVHARGIVIGKDSYLTFGEDERQRREVRTSS